MNLGFIGVGVINEAFVHAFCKSGMDIHIVLSKRNVERTKKLKELYKDKITIADTNQEVLDKSEYIFIAVLPKQLDDVYKDLKFNKSHKVFNLTRVDSYDTLKKYISDVSFLVHIIPLVFIQNVRGPIVMYPKNDEAKNILNKIGDVIEVDTWKDTVTLQAITGLEASYFTLLDVFNKWCKKQDMDIEVANKFVSSMFMAMSSQANIVDTKRVNELSNEYTEGGLNYKVKTHLQNKGDFDEWEKALDGLCQ